MQAPHEAHDRQKLHDLTLSLQAHGWQGPPLVKWGEEFLVTGSHRYAAARQLGWQDPNIPMVDLEDVFAEEGLDFAALHARHGHPMYDGSGFVELLWELSEEAREKYGIDWH